MKKLILVLVLILCCNLCACGRVEPEEEGMSDLELLARLVHCEANTESLECQKAIVSVVLNRLEAGKWGDTLEEVIYYPNAFTPATFGELEEAEPTAENYEAVTWVLENGPTLPTYVRYFRSGHHHEWEGYEGYKVIDHVYFGYFVDWQKGVW